MVVLWYCTGYGTQWIPYQSLHKLRVAISDFSEQNITLKSFTLYSLDPMSKFAQAEGGNQLFWPSSFRSTAISKNKRPSSHNPFLKGRSMFTSSLWVKTDDENVTKPFHHTMKHVNHFTRVYLLCVFLTHWQAYVLLGGFRIFKPSNSKVVTTVTLQLVLHTTNIIQLQLNYRLRRCGLCSPVFARHYCNGMAR